MDGSVREEEEEEEEESVRRGSFSAQGGSEQDRAGRAFAGAEKGPGREALAPGRQTKSPREAGRAGRGGRGGPRERRAEGEAQSWAVGGGRPLSSL